jgi:hypothetical protein
MKGSTEPFKIKVSIPIQGTTRQERDGLLREVRLCPVSCHGGERLCGAAHRQRRICMMKRRCCTTSRRDLPNGKHQHPWNR